MVGTTTSHYKILEKLGEGGMGVVYRAEDVRLRRSVALKFLPPELTRDGEAKKRFIHEAQAASALQHNNICTIHDIDETDDGRLFIVMDCYEGESLREKIVRGPMRVEDVVEIAVQITSGLSRAHEKGIVHRDIKPGNILVTPDGGVKIVDFGLAKLSGRTAVTKTGKTLGTVAYMSPEQARGDQVDHRTDIWSLGAVLYEMVAGQVPFRSEYSEAVVYSILNAEPEPITSLRSAVPMELERIVQKCMQKEQNERYQTMQDLLADLRHLQRMRVEGGSHARPETVRVPNRRILIGGLVLTAALATAVYLLFFATGEKRSLKARAMLVVLPFENLGSPADEYFAAGVTEEITSRLASIKDLGVISRSSALQYARTSKTIKQIGGELGVEYVLEGTVRWARVEGGPDRVRITPQLIRVSDDTHLWSEAYERVMSDIFAIQSQVAQAVAEKLGITLLEKERLAVEAHRTTNLDAYQAYLRGRYYQSRPHFSVDDQRRAVQSYQDAADLDPRFVSALAALSVAHARLYYYRYDPSDERRLLAQQALDRARALAPDASETHLAAGYYHWALREPDSALQEFAAASEGFPDNAEILDAKGELYLMQGRMEEAASSFREAFALSPRSAGLILSLGETYWWSRRYPEALEACNQAIALAPGAAWPYLIKVFNYWTWKGATDGARAALAAVPLEHEWALWSWYWQEVFEEKYQEALERLSASPDEWIRLKMWAMPKSLLSAYAYGFLNQHQKALAEYESARNLLETEVQAHPEDARYRSSLGIVFAALGRKEDAIREGKRAVELFPLSKDAVYALGHVQDMAVIYTMVGEHDLAMSELERLLSLPGYVSVPWIKMNPLWEPLHKNPRFQKLLQNRSVGDP